MRRDSEFRPQYSRYPTTEGVLGYLAERGVIVQNGPEAEVLRVIAALRPGLGVLEVAAEMSVNRPTLDRTFERAQLPPPREWIKLARALRAHRAILSGGTARDAAVAAGYYDQFTMSNALHRLTGFRPSALRVVTWQRLVDVWLARLRRHHRLAVRPADPSSE